MSFISPTDPFLSSDVLPQRYLSGDLAFREFDTLPVISALNIVLAQKPTDTGVKVGQNRYFFPSHERMDLGGGLEAWRGYFSSVRPRE